MRAGIVIKGGMLSGVVLAVATSAASATVTADLEKCRKIANGAERLTCYDSIAPKSNEQVHDEVQARQKAQFGLEERQKALDDRKEIEELTGSVAAVNGSRITLDNGMIWKVQDSDLLDWVRTGQKVTVSRGTLSGYRMTVEGVRAKAVVIRIQ